MITQMNRLFFLFSSPFKSYSLKVGPVDGRSHFHRDNPFRSHWPITELSFQVRDLNKAGESLFAPASAFYGETLADVR